MRNPDRIDPFMEKIAEAWKKFPDQRFGQFMLNVLREMSSKHGDPFFWEEDRFLEYMNEIDWLK